MEERKHMVAQRDYDKEPIQIIDYGVLFESSIVIIIVIMLAPFLISDIAEVIMNNSYFTFSSLKVLLLILIAISMLYICFMRDPKKFNQQKSYYKLTNNDIIYFHPGVTSGSDEAKLNVSVSSIDYVDYCIVSELHDRYGRFSKWSAWEHYKKSSIGVHIGKFTIFLYYSITYILIVLPYKIWYLFANKEKWTLLSKNIVVHFENRNYMLINIYTKKDLEEIKAFFEKKNIDIRENTHFIPHLQNQGWFVDKEETWSNEYTEEEENG